MKADNTLVPSWIAKPFNTVLQRANTLVGGGALSTKGGRNSEGYMSDSRAELRCHANTHTHTTSIIHPSIHTKHTTYFDRRRTWSQQGLSYGGMRQHEMGGGIIIQIKIEDFCTLQVGLFR